MATPKPTLLEAREGFVGEVDGQSIKIYKGDLVESDHPMVKKWPHLFGAVFLRYPIPQVEQATTATRKR